MIMLRMRDSRLRAAVLLLVLLLSVAAHAGAKEAVQASNGMVTAAHPLAVEAGLEMLKAGGNAIDAAVATSFALGVVEPHGSGLGGEGLMVIHLEEPDRDVVIDFRSMAPLDVTPEATSGEYAYHPKGAAVPGLVAGILKAHEQYGRLPLKQVLQPAIRLAREGFPVSRTLAQVLLDKYELILTKPATAEIYLPDDFPPAEGDIIKNPDLAWSLEQIAEDGADAFYKGAIAEKIVAYMEENDGLIGFDDLEAYEAIVREPARGTYRGYEVVAGPPPVAGTSVIANLNIWEHFNPDLFDYDDPLYIHIMAEIMKLTSVDRFAYVGDPGFAEVPVKGLTSDEYARERFVRISLDNSTTPGDAQPGPAKDYEDAELTFVKRTLAGPQTPSPDLYVAKVFSDSFVDEKPYGWVVLDGEWRLRNGAYEGTDGMIKTIQHFPADRMVEARIQTLETLGSKVWNVGRLFGKYIDGDNQIYGYLRTNGDIRFTVEYKGEKTDYNASTELDPMQPHVFRMLFLGNKAEMYIDDQKVLAVEDEKIGKLAGGIAFWSQDSSAVYDDVQVACLANDRVSDDSGREFSEYKYRAVEESFVNGLAHFDIRSGDWTVSEEGMVGTDGVIALPKALGVDRRVRVTMKTLETLGEQAWNVGRILGKYEDAQNRVYAYLRKDGQIRLTVELDDKNDNYDFAAPGISPFEEHEYQFIFAGDNVQFWIDGVKYADVTSDKVSQIAGGIAFWPQDAKALIKKITVDQTEAYTPTDGGNTTHVSIVDGDGNAVSLTQTISSFMGTGDVVPGTGFLLNNEMKNFGSGVNELRPGKRMRTTIAPTMLLKDGDVRLVVGSPGAARIITTVTEIIVNFVDFGMDIQAAIDAPKFISRTNYGELRMEGRYSEETVEFLKALGHKVKLYGDYDLYFGGAHAISVDPETGTLFGAADPRRDGAAAGF